MFVSVKRLVIPLMAAFVLAAPALSQETRLQGTIETIDAESLTIKKPDGASAAVTLAGDTAVFVNQPSSLDAIKPGDCVASTTVKTEDGKMHSKELRIFPEALRGLGDGARPMDAPNTTMINAGVSEVVAAPDGQLLKVKYKDGTAEFVVDAQTTVSAIVAAEIDALKQGSRVFLLASNGANGELIAKRIIGMR